MTHATSPLGSRPRDCSIAGALDVVGDRWALLVVRELIYGFHRFNDLARNTGAPRDILTARLRKLEELRVVERREYSSKPRRFEYVLTPLGRELSPVLQALKRWGDEHLVDGPPPVVLVHECGHEYVPVMHCQACGQPAQDRSLRHAVTADGPVDGLRRKGS